MTISFIRTSIAVAFALLVTVSPSHSAERLPLAITDSDYYDGGIAAEAKVELGRLLFFDKVLSGNRNISCGTCHHPTLASGDGLALPLGEGADGLGKARRSGTDLNSAVASRVPRNSPALFNVGARGFTRLFHDGRVEVDTNNFYHSGFITPAKWKLPNGLDNVLAAQAMFPVASPTEMAGQYGENPIGNAAFRNQAAGTDGVWELVAARVRVLPEYVDLFINAFPGEVSSENDISMVTIANAIAAFETVAFRADQSHFDAFLRGDQSALSASAIRGMTLFYGSAGCSRCHSGKFQTDHDFHAIAMPQIGPGKGDGYDGSFWQETGIRMMLEDYGRGRVTARAADRYKFRTPSLRNVALTAPYGHSGAYADLESVVRHHLDPVQSLESYEIDRTLLPDTPMIVEITARGAEYRTRALDGQRLHGFAKHDAWIQGNADLRNKIAAANELDATSLSDEQVADLLAFLHSLTDDRTRDVAAVPDSVPSGLPILD